MLSIVAEGRRIEGEERKRGRKSKGKGEQTTQWEGGREQGGELDREGEKSSLRR